MYDFLNKNQNKNYYKFVTQKTKKVLTVRNGLCYFEINSWKNYVKHTKCTKEKGICGNYQK